MKKAIYEFMNYFPFLKEVIKRDFKKKYYKSVLGVAWSMLSPLLMMIVITIVFSTLFKRDLPYYPAYWFSGNMLFGFVFEGSTAAMGSITNNASLIRKMKIPNYFFCISSVTQHFITMIFSILPYILVCMVIGVPMTVYMLLIPLPLILAYFFTLGLGMLLCAYGTFLRDLSYLYHVLRRVWLYITPIFYPIEIIPVDIGMDCDETPAGVLPRKVGHITGDILKEAAMSEEDCLKAIEIGIDIAKMCKDKGFHSKSHKGTDNGKGSGKRQCSC